MDSVIAMDAVRTKRPTRARRFLLIGSSTLISLFVLAAVARLAWPSVARNIEATATQFTPAGAMQMWLK
jgi:TRAP-type C4-dicarboxylate transport system permease small subunit